MRYVLITSFFIITFVSIHSCKQSMKQETTASETPILFTPDIPVDVDPVEQEKLKGLNDNYFALNQAFNMFSWQAFVAIFWPRDEQGQPMPNFTDDGKPTWLGWKEAFEVYKPDGGTPAPWGSARVESNPTLKANNINPEAHVRVFLSTSTPAHKGLTKNIANEVDQAFAGKLFDQQGNTVYYEVLMNKEEFDYLVANQLYNINGQIDFSKKNQIADFPKGDFASKQVGAVEIKFAWKIMTDADIKERYYINEGFVIDESTQKPVKKELGMIGFHISQKTPTGKQWVWSTFEHIDNLDQNTMDQDGRKKPIHPSLTDPNCEICPVNIDVSNGSDTFTYMAKSNTNPHSSYWKVTNNPHKYYANSDVMKTQAKRMIDIPVRVQQLNKALQAYFKSQNSVWQYYQLIDTQYPTDQNVAPGDSTVANYSLPTSITNKPGGNPNLTYLTNISMETFFQGGNQSASAFMENNPASDVTVFGTESCMGCHSSAGIYNGYNASGFTQGLQLSGDFSWLLSTKAKWNKNIAPYPAFKSK